jgi:hypothetical protein
VTPEAVLPRLSVLNWVSSEDADRLRTALAATDLEVRQLNGALITDAASLMAAFEALLGRSFASGGWDALRDVLPEIVGRSPTGHSCLVWDHVENMLEGGLPDLVSVLLLLVEASRDLARRERRFVTFLIGDGPNFPPLGTAQM